VCVRCAWSSRARELYALPLREPLKAIPIPLRENDRPVPLDLQMLLDRCYDDGRYDDINYAEPPIPPLELGDATWADELLKADRKR